MTRELTQVGLGGGCHWCTEAVFQHLRGVRDVEQGFIASTPPHDTLSEAIRLRFDEAIIPLRVLLAAHLHTHSSTSAHTLRSRYRSAVYTSGEALAYRARETLEMLQREWDKPFITAVLPLERFELNDERYLNYYATRSADAPFCKVHVEPKLVRLRDVFAGYYRPLGA